VSTTAEKPQRPGDTCKLCRQNVLWLIHGAVVCPKCDNAAEWPNAKDRS
jgi:hypothetical protein